MRDILGGVEVFVEITMKGRWTVAGSLPISVPGGRMIVKSVLE